LRKCGSHLSSAGAIPGSAAQPAADTSAQAIYAEADISPYARQRDAKVLRELPLKLTPGVTVQPVETLRKADGAPYTVFTPFSRMWQSLPSGKPLPPPEGLLHLLQSILLGYQTYLVFIARLISCWGGRRT